MVKRLLFLTMKSYNIESCHLFSVSWHIFPLWLSTWAMHKETGSVWCTDHTWQCLPRSTRVQLCRPLTSHHRSSQIHGLADPSGTIPRCTPAVLCTRGRAPGTRCPARLGCWPSARETVLDSYKLLFLQYLITLTLGLHFCLFQGCD